MNTVEKLALQNGVDMDNSILLFQNRLVNLRHQHIREIMSDYLHVSGRMEHVVTVGGIDFINDTKADSLNATWYSLENMTKPVIWITDLRYETCDMRFETNDIEFNVAHRTSHIASPSFEKIIPLLKKKVKAVILLDDDRLRATDYGLPIQHRDADPLFPRRGKSTEFHRASNSLVSNVANRKSQIANHVERVYTAHHIEHAVELAYTVGIPGDVVLFSPAGGEHNENYKHNGDLFSAAVKKL